jgi:hypothetical protein
MIWLRFEFKAATRLELFVPNAWVPYATLLLKPALKNQLYASRITLLLDRKV